MWWDNYKENWWQELEGKPWEISPVPPESFNCGELVRYAYKHIHGVDTVPIMADASRIRECISAMNDMSIYGLRPLTEDERPQEFDVAFIIQGTRESHVGLAIDTVEGLMVMHCIERVGVTVDSPREMLGQGWRAINWGRHKEYTPKCLK